MSWNFQPLTIGLLAVPIMLISPWIVVSIALFTVLMSSIFLFDSLIQKVHSDVRESSVSQSARKIRLPGSFFSIGFFLTVGFVGLGLLTGSGLLGALDLAGLLSTFTTFLSISLQMVCLLLTLRIIVAFCNCSLSSH